MARQRSWGGPDAIRRAMPEGYLTTAEAAAAIGRSPDTVARWRRGPNPVFCPRGKFQVATQPGKNLEVYGYSPDDIEEMKDIVRQMRRGHRKKTS